MFLLLCFEGFYQFKKDEIRSIIKIMEEEIFYEPHFKLLLIFQLLIDQVQEISLSNVGIQKCDLTFKQTKMLKYVSKLIELNVLPSPVFSRQII